MFGGGVGKEERGRVDAGEVLQDDHDGDCHLNLDRGRREEVSGTG